MEKINQSIRKNFPQVKLYLDDLIKIIDILEDNNFKKIEISTNTHKYCKEELKDIPYSDSISQVESKDPFYISITFNNGFGPGVNIRTGNDSILAEGIIQKIGRVLLSRKRSIHYYISKFWVALLIEILILTPSVYFILKKDITLSTFFLITFCVMAINFFCMLIDSGRIFRKNIFFYKIKEEQPNFWTRKKDEIIVGIIVAIITIPLTVIITRLIGMK
jgi:hypothetical protein